MKKNGSEWPTGRRRKKALDGPEWKTARESYQKRYGETDHLSKT